jgi:sec-independent protein translocase protein TatA|tara:strand:+ start:10253 stop:10453 length:201 start_codon:yes stop_codon:yes gene_type:complete
MLLFIGGPEIIIILLFVVLFFGANKIPELARGMGKAMRELRDASNEIKKDIRASSEDIKDNFDLDK